MKTIGLIGGMSWESTLDYYRVMNEVTAEKLGGLHSARLLMHSVDFAPMAENLRRGDWDANAKILCDAARGLENAGAELMVIGTNTMHKVASAVQGAVHVPLLHIAAAAADELEEMRAEKVALLGTKYTMQEDFYKERLRARGFSVRLPSLVQMETLNDIIFDELCRGIFSGSAKAFLQTLVRKLAGQGAQAVVLGCTELPLLLRQEDTPVPLLNTTEVHARRAALLALT